MLREVDLGANIYRVRIGQNKYATARELGAPPPKSATQSNRMSPAGIPMFYGAFDEQTAILETYDPNMKNEDRLISIGIFQPVRKLIFLDLARLPKIPSIFNLDRQYMIHSLSFIYDFAEDISKPISRNGKEHVEYVPTQVVTEFFRHIYRTNDKKKLDGIIYNSSKDDGKEACVIFCENEQACDLGDCRNDDCMLELTEMITRSCADPYTST